MVMIGNWGTRMGEIWNLGYKNWGTKMGVGMVNHGGTIFCLTRVSYFRLRWQKMGRLKESYGA